MEASGGSPAWQLSAQVDIGKEEPKTLEIDPHWRAQWWLQVAAQGIRDKEVLWHELLTPLTSGAEGVAKSLAKHLVAAWQWNIKVRGEGLCPPALNIGQFLIDEEVEGGMGETHLFVAYSHTLQWLGEAAHGRKWEARREALEIKASPLVHAFWHETDIDLMMASVKHCWEPVPRTLHHQRENGPTTHVISYLDELAVHIPTRGMGPNGVANHGTNSACTHRSQVLWLLLGPSGGSRPCNACSTILCYRRKGDLPVHHESPSVQGEYPRIQPSLNEAEWVLVCGLANDLS